MQRALQQAHATHAHTYARPMLGGWGERFTHPDAWACVCVCHRCEVDAVRESGFPQPIFPQSGFLHQPGFIPEPGFLQPEATVLSSLAGSGSSSTSVTDAESPSRTSPTASPPPPSSPTPTNVAAPPPSPAHGAAPDALDMAEDIGDEMIAVRTADVRARTPRSPWWPGKAAGPCSLRDIPTHSLRAVVAVHCRRPYHRWRSSYRCSARMTSC